MHVLILLQILFMLLSPYDIINPRHKGIRQLASSHIDYLRLAGVSNSQILINPTLRPSAYRHGHRQQDAGCDAVGQCYTSDCDCSYLRLLSPDESSEAAYFRSL